MKKGFTLLELLFILIILSVFLTIILTSYQYRSTNNKIEQTAIRMQQMMQAAYAYQVDKGYWPDANQTDFTQYYLPIGNDTNAWGNAFSISTDSNNNFAITSGELPNKQIAARIQALLPNASLDTDHDQVVMSYLLPNIRNFPLETIGNTGVISNGASGSFHVACPNNGSAQAIAIPNYIAPITYKPYFTNEWCPQGSAPFGSLDAPITCQGEGNNITCSYTVSFSTLIPQPVPFCMSTQREDAGAVSFTYMAWCAS